MVVGRELGCYKKKIVKNKRILTINCPLLISVSRFEVLVCTTFFVVASSVLLVTRRRGGTLSTVVVAAVSALPAVLVVVATGGLDACSAEVLAKVGDGDLEIGEVLKGNE